MAGRPIHKHTASKYVCPDVAEDKRPAAEQRQQELHSGVSSSSRERQQGEGGSWKRGLVDFSVCCMKIAEGHSPQGPQMTCGRL